MLFLYFKNMEQNTREKKKKKEMNHLVLEFQKTYVPLHTNIGTIVYQYKHTQRI